MWTTQSKQIGCFYWSPNRCLACKNICSYIIKNANLDISSKQIMISSFENILLNIQALHVLPSESNYCLKLFMNLKEICFLPQFFPPFQTKLLIQLLQNFLHNVVLQRLLIWEHHILQMIVLIMILIIIIRSQKKFLHLIPLIWNGCPFQGVKQIPLLGSLSLKILLTLILWVTL